MSTLSLNYECYDKYETINFEYIRYTYNRLLQKSLCSSRGYHNKIQFLKIFCLSLPISCVTLKNTNRYKIKSHSYLTLQIILIHISMGSLSWV